jgi:DNA-binding MarR family transcriptional regulator
MSSKETTRTELLSAVLLKTRKMTGQGILFSQAVADRLGLAVTDAEALEQLAAMGRATAGQIAELTGLTTGAATRMIDRLEQSGFVRRGVDPADRRRVIVEPILERVRDVETQYASLRAATRSAIERYSDHDLVLIRDYLDRALEAGRSETARLTEAPTTPGPDSSSIAPLGGTASGRLVFISGAPNLTLRGDRSVAELYRAKFSGPIPKVRVRDGTVTVRYGRFSWFEWRGRIAGQMIDAAAHWRDDRGDIALNTSVPWTIEIRGGVSRVTADLRDLDLAAFEVTGGVSRIDLNLPAPRALAQIQIGGGANDVAVHRPAGVACRLHVRGGANKVTFDGQAARKGLQIEFETKDFAGRGPGYEIELTGGANRLTVDTR